MEKWHVVWNARDDEGNWNDGNVEVASKADADALVAAKLVELNADGWLYASAWCFDECAKSGCDWALYEED